MPVVSASSSWFAGVRAAQNKGGSPPSILVQWNAASVPVLGYRVYSLIYDPVTKTNKQALLKEVSPESTSYLYSNDLIAGSTYTFMVRAVDVSGDEDTNTVQVSTVAFNGIAGVRITGPTTATVMLESSIGSFDEIRVYAQPDREGGIKTKVASATGDVSSIDIKGLRSGVKYKFSINAYMSYLNSEDGNEFFAVGQTHSDSFGSGAPSEKKDKYQYRGMLSVQAFGDAPNAPAPPTQRMVRLTWLPFYAATSVTTYKVVRAASSIAVNTTTTLPCTSATDVSCLVNCTNVGTGPQTCEDHNVAAPPKTYNYVVTLQKKDSSTGETWVEELPPTNALDFYTKVAIPPENMVLVQRDAANYEMCTMIGTESDPRKWQRCTYTGIAGTPYNRGPNKPPLNMEPGFYDFGYNLFVDRFRVGCNWTRVSPSCGPDGCVGTPSLTTSSAPPSASLGVAGDVYFAVNGGYGNNCYYKKGASWVSVGDPNNGLTPAQLRSATTMDPATDKKVPQLNGVSQGSAFNICDSHGTEYGNKRLLRRREFVQATAFATLPGEPGAVTDKVQAGYIRTGNYSASANRGGQLPGFNWCASGSESHLLMIPTTLAQMLDPLNHRSKINLGVTPYANIMSSQYFVGTEATKNCVTRWGSQDPFSNSMMDDASAVLADTFYRNNDINVDPPTFIPVDSDFDSGVVRDWQSPFLTYQFNGLVGPAIGTASTWLIDVTLNTSTAETYKSFIIPLGMPLVPATTSSALYAPYKSTASLVFSGGLGSDAFGGGGNATFRVVNRSSSLTPITGLKFILAEGNNNRFSYLLHNDGSTSRFGVWCGLEAE